MTNIGIKKRNSSIEALKILGVFLIVISHVVQTLGSNGNVYVPNIDFGINLSVATTDLQRLVLSMLRYNGSFGNTIFFVCSAWFLLDSKRFNKKKILLMLAEVWTISVLILLIVLFLRKGDLNASLILISFFPSFFDLNWYINCYLIFYAIHPALNRIIASLNQKSLFKTVFVMTILYPVMAFVSRLTLHLFDAGSSFFANNLVTWIVIYFYIAYLKYYAENVANNIRINCCLAAVGFFGFFGLVAMTNYVGLKTNLLNGALQIWNVPYNPFLLLLVIGMFNLVRRISFENKTINYISKLSFYIYLIHENNLLRKLYRPAMWNYVYEKYGDSYVLGWVLIFALFIYVFGLLSSTFYFETVHKLIVQLCDKIYPKITSIWKEFEKKILKNSRKDKFL